MIACDSHNQFQDLRLLRPFSSPALRHIFPLLELPLATTGHATAPLQKWKKPACRRLTLAATIVAAGTCFVFQILYC